MKSVNFPILDDVDKKSVPLFCGSAIILSNYLEFSLRLKLYNLPTAGGKQ